MKRTRKLTIQVVFTLEYPVDDHPIIEQGFQQEAKDFFANDYSADTYANEKLTPVSYEIIKDEILEKKS